MAAQSPHNWELAPFPNLRACMTCVFGSGSSSAPPSSIYKLAGPGRRDATRNVKPIEPRPRPINWEEAAAERGMVKRWLYAMQSPYNAALIASYGYGPERANAQNVLTTFVIPRLSMTIRKRRIIYELVCGSYGKIINHAALCDRYDMPVRVVDQYMLEVRAVIASVNFMADELATVGLRERGVID